MIMLKADIKKELSQYKNVLDLIREANALKKKGESEIMVNRVVAELRKEMLVSHDSINLLKRRHIHETPIEPIGAIPVQVDNLATPLVVFDGVNVLM